MAPEKAIVISTHILEEVDAVCTRAIIIAARQRGGGCDAGGTAARHPSGKLDDVFRAILTHAGGGLSMRNVLIVAGRELAGYFATPVASVFIVIFLVLRAR